MAMLLLGFSSGLPLFLTNFTLQQWLSESRVSLRAIGATALIGLPYTLKFLWAPVFDRTVLPVLGRALGRRRGWLLPVQLGLAAAILILGGRDPARHLGALAAAAVAVAFLSASQDVVVDAWRIESFSARRQGAALALYVWGYRVGMLAANAGTIWLAGRIGWHAAYAVAAALVGLGVAGTLVAPRVAPAGAPSDIPGGAPRVAPAGAPGDMPGGTPGDVPGGASPVGSGLRGAFAGPIADFLRRDRAVPILALVLLFQLGTAFADSMAAPFYRALGFDRNAVALANTVPILAGVFAGSAAGALLVARLGAPRALLAGGLGQTASLLLYVGLAVSAAHPALLAGKVLLESFAEALASTAFLSYLSALCSASYTATQYALLSSLAPLAWRTVAGFSGVLAAALGWPAYFLACAAAGLPALALLAWLGVRAPR